ncbi:carboxypeptidase-like regulatory domain-containing protein [Oceanithermus sp.]
MKKAFILLTAALLIGVLSACDDLTSLLDDATLSGTVVDATTGEGISGAQACLVATGECALTDVEGAFTLSGLPEGSQTIEVSATGYTTLRQSVSLVNGETTEATFMLNPSLAQGEYRVVLSWGSNPEDLDSHLWVPLADGTYYEVYFGDEGTCSSDPWACLDVDDTDGYGPETITIAQMQGGVYSYAVHWYSGTGTWAGSEAVVRLYDADGLVREFSAPNDSTYGEDSWWYVFDFENGVVTSKDLLSTTPPLPSSVSLQRVK